MKVSTERKRINTILTNFKVLNGMHFPAQPFRLLYLIGSYDNFFMSQNEMMKRVDMAKPTIRKHIDWLINHNLISESTKFVHGKTKNSYKIKNVEEWKVKRIDNKLHLKSNKVHSKGNILPIEKSEDKKMFTEVKETFSEEGKNLCPIIDNLKRINENIKANIYLAPPTINDESDVEINSKRLVEIDPDEPNNFRSKKE